MTIREMRKKIGLTQTEFAEVYHIPLQTLRQWESNEGTTSHRKPPEYVEALLARAVQRDFGVCLVPMDRAEDLIDSASHSYGSGFVWLSYLSKQFDGDELLLSSGQLKKVLASRDLTSLQKIMLQRAATPGTATNRYVLAMRRPVETLRVAPLIEDIRKKKALRERAQKGEKNGN